MLITHEREKLINAIVYFASNTTQCGITKLMKLLFLLDFDHFKQTGRNVTGMDYYAYPMGPVPGEVHDELSNCLRDDMASAISIVPERVVNHTRLTVTAQRPFDSKHFSKRELRILESICNTYRSHLAQQMVDVTHAENGVWDQVYAKGEGNRCRIPYELSLPEAEHPDLMLEKSKEFDFLKRHFSKDSVAVH